MTVKVRDEDGFVCTGMGHEPKRPRSMRWKAYVATWCIKMIAKFVKLAAGMDVKAYNKGSIPKWIPVFCAGGPHKSFGDPVLWGATISRNGAIIAAAELAKLKFIGPILRWLFSVRGDILVVRTGEDKNRNEALEQADYIFSRGGLVAAFAEGGINKGRWNKGLFGAIKKYEGAIVLTHFEGVGDFWASTRDEIAAREGKVLDFRAKMRISYSNPFYYDDYKHLSDVEMADFFQRCNESFVIC